MSIRSVVVVMASAFALAGCAGMRWFNLPLSPAEGQTMVPALISAAQSQGLEAFHGASGGAVAYLEDRTMLSWQDSADHRDFILLIDLPKTPKDQLENAFLNAKARADQLWQIAMAQRQSMLPTPVMAYPPPAVPYPPRPPGAYAPPPVQAPPLATSCGSGLDCAGTLTCRDRGDGVKVCMGNGAQGAYCAYGTDCAGALSCRPTYGAIMTCQP